MNLFELIVEWAIEHKYNYNIVDYDCPTYIKFKPLIINNKYLSIGKDRIIYISPLGQVIKLNAVDPTFLNKLKKIIK